MKLRLLIFGIFLTMATTAIVSEQFLVHGEEEAKRALRQCFANEGWKSEIPGSGDSILF